MSPKPAHDAVVTPSGTVRPKSVARPFLVGAGMAEITPPLEVGLLMSSVERRWAPFVGTRLPLHARALVVQNRTSRMALVSLELLGLTEEAVGGMESFRRRIVAAVGGGIAEPQLLLASVHTHSAPDTLALTDLHHTAAFRQWVDLLVERIAAAIATGLASARPCSFGMARTSAPGLGIHRRIKTTQGILLSHPMPAPEITISRDGAVDHSVHVGAFTDSAGHPVGLLVNAACHPVHEMCRPEVSPDYPGIASVALERHYPGCTTLFFNGAAGNVNPPTVSAGPAAAEQHGLRLAELVSDLVGELEPVGGDDLSIAWRPVHLPARSLNGHQGAAFIHTRIAAARIAQVGIALLPGEPFAETGLAIREASPFPLTFVIGYAEGSVGYMPTDEAFREGGYETGPGAWSKLAPGSEGLVRRTALELLEGLHAARPAASASADQLAPR